MFSSWLLLLVTPELYSGMLRYFDPFAGELSSPAYVLAALGLDDPSLLLPEGTSLNATGMSSTESVSSTCRTSISFGTRCFSLLCFVEFAALAVVLAAVSLVLLIYFVQLIDCSVRAPDSSLLLSFADLPDSLFLTGEHLAAF